MAEYLNKNIRYLRKIKKVSQLEVSEKTKIDRTLLSRIENDKVETSIDNVQKLADYFNVSIADLVGKDLEFEEPQKNELDVLFDKHKDILTDSDMQMIKFIIEQRKKEIDNME